MFAEDMQNGPRPLLKSKFSIHNLIRKQHTENSSLHQDPNAVFQITPNRVAVDTNTNFTPPAEEMFVHHQYPPSHPQYLSADYYSQRIPYYPYDYFHPLNMAAPSCLAQNYVNLGLLNRQMGISPYELQGYESKLKMTETRWQEALNFIGNPMYEKSYFFNHHLQRTKRIRTAFTANQLTGLEAAFRRNHYVVGSERKALAQVLHLSETQVKVWFQNRRTKLKRQSCKLNPDEEDINQESSSPFTCLSTAALDTQKSIASRISLSPLDQDYDHWNPTTTSYSI